MSEVARRPLRGTHWVQGATDMLDRLLSVVLMVVSLSAAVVVQAGQPTPTPTPTPTAPAQPASGQPTPAPGVKPAPPAQPAATEQPAADKAGFKEEELDQMVAPIALYPDSLLSQIFMASTYPLEIVQADRWAKATKSLQGEAMAKELEKQTWDPSVKSLVNFPD